MGTASSSASQPGDTSVASSRALSRCSVALAAIAVVSMSGCFSFSSFQSASIVPPGSFSTSVAVTRNDWVDQSTQRSSDFHWTNYEFRGRSGTKNEDFDTGGRIVIMKIEDDIEAQIGIDGRYALVPKRLTFQFPATIWLVSEAFNSLQIEPTLIASAPLSKAVEVNASWSFRYEPKGGSTSYSGSFGLALQTPFETVRLRPEIAWLGGVGDADGFAYRQFGLAVEFSGQGKDGEANEPWW